MHGDEAIVLVWFFGEAEEVAAYEFDLDVVALIPFRVEVSFIERVVHALVALVIWRLDGDDAHAEELLE